MFQRIWDREGRLVASCVQEVSLSLPSDSFFSSYYSCYCKVVGYASPRHNVVIWIAPKFFSLTFG